MVVFDFSPKQDIASFEQWLFDSQFSVCSRCGFLPISDPPNMRTGLLGAHVLRVCSSVYSPLPLVSRHSDGLRSNAGKSREQFSKYWQSAVQILVYIKATPSVMVHGRAPWDKEGCPQAHSLQFITYIDEASTTNHVHTQAARTTYVQFRRRVQPVLQDTHMCLLDDEQSANIAVQYSSRWYSGSVHAGFRPRGIEIQVLYDKPERDINCDNDRQLTENTWIFYQVNVLPSVRKLL